MSLIVTEEEIYLP